jgi:hypothetical protein
MSPVTTMGAGGRLGLQDDGMWGLLRRSVFLRLSCLFPAQ